MELSCVFFGLLFTAAGLLFACGKLHGHIKAWKGMTDKERDSINITALVRNVGGVIMLCGLIFLAKGLLAEFPKRLFVGAMIIWLIIAGLDLRYISVSDRYRNK